MTFMGAPLSRMQSAAGFPQRLFNSIARFGPGCKEGFRETGAFRAFPDGRSSEAGRLVTGSVPLIFLHIDAEIDDLDAVGAKAVALLVKAAEGEGAA